MQSAYTGGGDVQSSLDEEGEYWVRKEAEKRWNASLKEDKPAPDLDPKDMDERISAMVDERLARQTDDREFKFTVAQFKKENKLPKEANERLAGEWKELVSLGMSKTKAFEKATQIIGVAFEKDIADAEVRGAQRANMATPSASPSNSKPEPSLNDMDPSEMSGDDFLKWGNAQAKESIKSRVSSK